MFEDSDVKPDGSPDAVVWKGNHDGSVNPVAHSLTDYALLGTLAAIDILGLPTTRCRCGRSTVTLRNWPRFPGSATCRASSSGRLPVMLTNDGKGGKVVVMGKSLNAPLRTQAGVYCNVRLYTGYGCSLYALPAPIRRTRLYSMLIPRPGIFIPK